MNAATILEDAARALPAKLAVIDREAQYTYRELDALANRVANGLRAAGIGKGDRVVISCPNSVHFVALFFGVVKLGAVAVPINLMLRRREIEYLLAQSDAAAYVCHAGTPEFPVGQEGHGAFTAVDSCRHFWMIPGDSSAGLPDVPSWDSLVDQAADFESVCCGAGDMAEIMYSSGTTGRSKGTVHSIGSLIINELMMRDRSGFVQGDVTFAMMPFFNGFCRTVAMLPTILVGGTLVTAQKFRPREAWDGIVKHKATMFPGVPMMYAGMLETGPVPELGSLSHWRLALSSGAILPVQLQEEFKARTGIIIRQLYGMCEARAMCTESPGDPMSPLSCGRPLWGTVMRCLDERRQPLPPGQIGDLEVGGLGVMDCYFNDPAATEEVMQQGWLSTGDKGFIDGAGEIHVVGRTKDMITRGGNHVYPAEVEQALLTHPAIANAAVVGAPDERLGEEVCAFVSLKEGVECGSEALIAWAKENISAHAWPRRIQILPALPTGIMGKILKSELRKMVLNPMHDTQPALPSESEPAR